MPNWCSIDCSINGPRDDIDAFRQRHIQKMENGEIGIDFNTVIPMPDGMLDCGTSLYDELFALGEDFPPSGDTFTDYSRRSHRSPDKWNDKGIITKVQLLEWFEQNHPDRLALARRQITFHRETGFYDWYEWSCVNWGTKWNCNDFYMDSGDTSFDFSFCTAWSPPIPVFDKLARLHPSLTISLKYEERGDWFAGHVMYQVGKMVSHDTFEPECDYSIEEVE